MKVIFGSTSAGYGFCGRTGDVITCTFDSIEGKISYSTLREGVETDHGVMHSDARFKDEAE